MSGWAAEKGGSALTRDLSTQQQPRHGRVSSSPCAHTSRQKLTRPSRYSFVGYVVCQFPLGFFVAKISPAVYLSGAAMAWGVVSMCSGFTHSFGAMVVVRFLVGATEAVSSEHSAQPKRR